MKKSVRKKRPMKKTPSGLLVPAGTENDGAKLDSTNYNFPDSLVDYEFEENSGYPLECAARDTPEGMAMLGARDFPDSLWIDEKDWKDWARENDKHGTWAENYRNRFTNQSPTHECTCHALTQCFEGCWNKQNAGKEKPVYVSQISIYAEANERQWGGAGCQQVLGIALRRGFLPEPIHGQDKIFKHTLHGTCGKGNANNSSGRWVAVRNFPEGWQETAMNLRPLEVINPKTWQQIVCLLLRGFLVGVGRSGHSIPYNMVVWRNGELFIAYPDSYDVIRFDSMRMLRSAVGGSYSITSVVDYAPSLRLAA